jgi:hypothetical protein
VEEAKLTLTRAETLGVRRFDKDQFPQHHHAIENGIAAVSDPTLMKPRDRTQGQT